MGFWAKLQRLFSGPARLLPASTGQPQVTVGQLSERQRDDLREIVRGAIHLRICSAYSDPVTVNCLLDLRRASSEIPRILLGCAAEHAMTWEAAHECATARRGDVDCRVWEPTGRDRLHAKFMIAHQTDGSVVVAAGSANLTQAGLLRNVEVLTVVRGSAGDSAIAPFIEAFDNLFQHARPADSFLQIHPKPRLTLVDDGVEERGRPEPVSRSQPVEGESRGQGTGTSVATIAKRRRPPFGPRRRGNRYAWRWQQATLVPSGRALRLFAPKAPCS